MIATWPCPLNDGAICDELLVTIGDAGKATLLIIPPLFGEHNLMRRQLLLVMRALEASGVTAHLPDLPGLNESTQPLRGQSLAGWRAMVAEAVRHVQARQILAVRSGALLVPRNATGWLYAPQSGSKLIRGMMRAQGISNREAGIDLTSEQMTDIARSQGICLSGWGIGAQLFRELEDADVRSSPQMREITQQELGSPGLWLRAEPDENADQAARIAKVISASLAPPEASEA